MVHGDSIMKFLQNDNDTMAYFNKILSLNFLIFFLFPVNYPTDDDKLSRRSKRHSLFWVRIKTGIRIHKSNSIPIEPPHKTQYLLHVGLCGKVIRYFV